MQADGIARSTYYDRPALSFDDTALVAKEDYFEAYGYRRMQADPAGHARAAFRSAVEAGQTAKAPFIRMADRFQLFLLPATLAVAGAAWWDRAILSPRSRSLLWRPLSSHPCRPVAFIGGVSRAARKVSS